MTVVDPASGLRWGLALLLSLPCAATKGQEPSNLDSTSRAQGAAEGSPDNPPVESADVEPETAEPIVDDYQLQGEYTSLDSETSRHAVRLGLQVIALGNHQFRGVLLPGGLPGNGWNRRDRILLEGETTGDRVVLSSEDYQIELRDGGAVVTPSGSASAVQLAKVQRRSPYAGLAPPSGSIVLFDGRDTAAFKKGKIQDGLLQVGTELIPTFRNYHLHVEFLLPFMPAARGQGRANSGVYLQSRYEVQILDSFGLEGVFNECGSLYRQRPPDLNMAFPPVTWQTYDITFRAPVFDACGNKCLDARITLLHNGVPVHNNVPIIGKTGAGQPEGPIALPIKLQDHGNPVQFRNIWLMELN